jgi:hypothetical protein
MRAKAKDIKIHMSTKTLGFSELDIQSSDDNFSSRREKGRV